MEDNVDIRYKEVTKWLAFLLYAGVIRFVNGVVGFLPFVPAVITNLVTWGEWICVSICLCKLAGHHERYRKAMLFYGAMMICALFSVVIFPSSLLVTAASVFAVLSAYQEYCGHSELLLDIDKKLSDRWHSLFTWSIISAVLTGFCSVAAVMIVALSGGDSAVMTSVIVSVLAIPQLVIDIVYLLYIKKMRSLFHWWTRC